MIAEIPGRAGIQAYLLNDRPSRVSTTYYHLRWHKSGTELTRRLYISPISVQPTDCQNYKKRGVCGSGEENVFLATVEKMLHRYGASHLPVRYEVGSWEAAKLTVVHGLGVTILPRHAVAKEIAARQLKELRFGKEALRAKIYVVQRRTKLMPSAVTTFRKFLLQ